MLVGVDPVAGMEDMTTSSDSLISYLRNYGIMTLEQVCTLWVGSDLDSYWLTAEDLKLGSDWKVEWD